MKEIPIEPDLGKPDFVRDLILHHEQAEEIGYAFGTNLDVADALTGDLAPVLTNSMMTVLMESSNPVALLAHLARNEAETREPRDASTTLRAGETHATRLVRCLSRGWRFRAKQTIGSNVDKNGCC